MQIRGSPKTEFFYRGAGWGGKEGRNSLMPSNRRKGERTRKEDR